MKTISIILTLFLISLSSAHAQDSVTIQILSTFGLNLNAKLPIVDSLYPLGESSVKNRSKQLNLDKMARKELLKNCKKNNGSKLTSFNKMRLIPSNLVFETFKKTDSTSWKYFETIKPFYLISNPLFFNKGNKAIIDIDLFGGSGFTYILKKQNGTWTIEKEILRWVV